MKNLAGVKECDDVMREELRLAEVEVIPATPEEMKYTEVPFTIAGRLGDFHFRRAWYYWVVTGPMPLAAAQKLNDLWGSYVRAAGYAGGIATGELDRWARGGVIDTYHVDSQAGLCALTAAVRSL